MTAFASPFSPKLIAEVRRLTAAGWKPIEIHRILAKDGTSPLPTYRTVCLWANESASERHRELGRRTMARVRARANGGRMPDRYRRTDAWKLERIRSLSELGFGPRQIAKVMAFDLPQEADQFTQATVSLALDAGRWPVDFFEEDAA